MSESVTITFGKANANIEKNATFIQQKINEKYPALEVKLVAQQMNSSTLDVAVTKNNVYSVFWSVTGGDALVDSGNLDAFMAKLAAAL